MATAVQGLNVTEMLNIGKDVVIASVWPLPFKISRPFKTRSTGGYNHDYIIPACTDREKPVTVTIGDALERVYIGNSKYQEVLVQGGARAIAEDILKNTRDASPNASYGSGVCPGIWICEHAAPMESEKQRAIQQQTAYFDMRSKRADDNWFNGQKDQVGSLDRVGAWWLGLDPKDHPWMHNTQVADNKKCPYCTKDIPSSAIKCPECKEIVDAAGYKAMQTRLEAGEQPPPPPEPKPVTPPVFEKPVIEPPKYAKR